MQQVNQAILILLPECSSADAGAPAPDAPHRLVHPDRVPVSPDLNTLAGITDFKWYRGENVSIPKTVHNIKEEGAGGFPLLTHSFVT